MFTSYNAIFVLLDYYCKTKAVEGKLHSNEMYEEIGDG
jgi:hypothetical protein